MEFPGLVGCDLERAKCIIRSKLGPHTQVHFVTVPYRQQRQVMLQDRASNTIVLWHDERYNAVAVTPRAPRLAGLVTGALGFAATLTPYLLHVRGYLPGAGLNDLLRFERFQATPGLSHLELLVQTDGLWAWIVDRAGGFVVAFDEGSRHSYWKAFGSVYWSVPLAGYV